VAESVFLVWHDHGPDDSDNAKLLGVFSSPERAQQRVDAALTEPGFADHPDGFVVSEYPVDKDEWTEGFVELGEDD
jgi:homoserine kinase type II